MKKSMMIGLLFLIIIMIGVSPILISYVKNTQTINEVHVDKLERNRAIDSEEQATVLNNIYTIVHSDLAQKNKNFNLDSNISESQSGKTLEKKIIEQLKQLQELSVIPHLDFNQDYFLKNLYQNTYLKDSALSTEEIGDSQKTTVSYTLTTIGFEIHFEECDIHVIVDSQTGVIYELDLFCSEEITDNIIAENFFQYLGLNQKNMTYQTNKLGNYYIYSDNEMSFKYAYSQDSRIISYKLKS